MDVKISVLSTQDMISTYHDKIVVGQGREVREEPGEAGIPALNTQEFLGYNLQPKELTIHPSVYLKYWGRSNCWGIS